VYGRIQGVYWGTWKHEAAGSYSLLQHRSYNLFYLLCWAGLSNIIVCFVWQEAGTLPKQDNDPLDILELSINSPKIRTSTHFRSERVGCQINVRKTEKARPGIEPRVSLIPEGRANRCTTGPFVGEESPTPTILGRVTPTFLTT